MRIPILLICASLLPSFSWAETTATALPPSPATANASSTAAGPIEAQAEALLIKGREALSAGDIELAIGTLNRLLRLPPTPFKQEGQELIGVARERNGQISRAKIEYELYLKEYPTGEGAERVRQRLANLAPAQTPKLRVAKRREEVSETLVFGSLSQNYYYGNTHAEIITNTPTTVDNASLSSTDQSAIITNLDLNARFRSSEYDNRLVLRDTHTLNFLKTGKDDNRLTAAFFDLKNKEHDYSARMGRQTGNSGGILGRFDGVLGGYGVAPKWRVNGVIGTPAENSGVESQRYFYGASVDGGTFAERWNGNVYTIHQLVDNITDRLAVGAELRYFDANRSAYSLIDYDASYGVLNVALFQGNQISEDGTSYTLLFDHRKTPTMQTTNALSGETTTSIRTVLQSISEDELRRRAKALTATSDFLMFGVTRPFTPRWQLGGDIKLSQVSGTSASGTLPATEGTGIVTTYTLQAIGTGLVFDKDITVFNGSLITGRQYDGQSLSINNLSTFQDKWTVDGALRLYAQKDNLGTKLTRISPTVRIGYKMKENFTLEGEAGLEHSTTNGTTQQDTTQRSFFFIGYRWDL